ncbi:hypothetical protein AGMMS50268_09850 [Spirochaetia bacterium]|nr:hypothetical protein AGMMS50268_09850 [Spirochaetia bacterium]
MGFGRNFGVRVIFAAIFFVLPLLVNAQSKYALVIGNGAYSSITKLNNPVNDATDMEAALKGLGFQVELVRNGSRVQMEQAVGRLKNRLSGSKNAYGFFFYAGHGVQSQGENFLIPVDADISSEAYLRDRAVNVQAVLSELNTAGNELNVIVLDACRNNPFSWSRSGTRGLTMVGRQPPGSIIVYATSAEATAADGTGRNGLFTTHLLNNLKTPDMEVSEVFRRTGSDVRRASNSGQIPAIYSQFFETAYLGNRPVAVTPQPAPAPVVQPKPAVPPAPAPTPTVQPVAPPPERPVPEGFVRIEGGTFTMGSPSSEAARFSDEGPQHTVSISAFYMGKYEVTQKEWAAVMGNNPSNFKGDNLPVERVSWYEAVAYCNARSQKEGLNPAYTINGETVTWNRNANGYRLPTEAEWEYACRAATTTPFNTGNNITTTQANYNGNYPYNNNAKGENRRKTTAVGSFAPNRWGLYDMHGNVWEWCWDWYDGYSTAAQTDPMGASSGSYRVLRGGSWSIFAEYLRSACRYNRAPSYRDDYFGFRVARP